MILSVSAVAFVLFLFFFCCCFCGCCCFGCSCCSFIHSFVCLFLFLSFFLSFVFCFVCFFCLFVCFVLFVEFVCFACFVCFVLFCHFLFCFVLFCLFVAICHCLRLLLLLLLLLLLFLLLLLHCLLSLVVVAVTVAAVCLSWLQAKCGWQNYAKLAQVCSGAQCRRFALRLAARSLLPFAVAVELSSPSGGNILISTSAQQTQKPTKQPKQRYLQGNKKTDEGVVNLVDIILVSFDCGSFAVQSLLSLVTSRSQQKAGHEATITRGHIVFPCLC